MKSVYEREDYYIGRIKQSFIGFRFFIWYWMDCMETIIQKKKKVQVKTKQVKKQKEECPKRLRSNAYM